MVEWETVVGVIIVLFLEDASSDNMGKKEFSVGTLSFKEGTSLTKFPTVEDVREAFLLYHMNITPRAMTHMPTDTNKGQNNCGGIMKMGSFNLYSQEQYQTFPLAW